MSALRDAIRQLYTDLDHISASYPEVTDTDVADAVHLALTYYFVWEQEIDPFPIAFGMWSEDGDLRVRHALMKFLQTVRQHANHLASLPVGQQRLNALQDPNIVSPGGRLYDEFIGHRDDPLPLRALPKYLFQRTESEEEEP